MKYKELTEKIIGCAYRVYNRMGYGLLESVYKKMFVVLTINFGEQKVGIKRKVRDFDEDLQDEF